MLVINEIERRKLEKAKERMKRENLNKKDRRNTVVPKEKKMKEDRNTVNQ